MSESKSLKRQSSMSEDFGVFLHNPAKGTYCGNRNPEAWRKILGFYFIYYICIGSFWAICFAGMMANVPPNNEGPLTQRSSGQSDVYAYAHIRTGNPQLFPTSRTSDPMEKGDLESIDFRFEDLGVAYDQIDKLFDSYGKTNANCSSAAKNAFNDTSACGPSYGWAANGSPCLFVKMANVWGFPAPDSDVRIRCHYRQKHENGTDTRVNVDIISFDFALGASGCDATQIGNTIPIDAATDGEYGSFPKVPFMGHEGTPFQPVVAFKLAPLAPSASNKPARLSVWCDMPSVDQGQLAGGDPEVDVTVETHA